MNPNIGKSQYKQISISFSHLRLPERPTFLTTVGYNTVVNIIIQIQAADRQNLEAKAKMLVISLKLDIDKKYTIVMRKDVTDVEDGTDIVAEDLRPKLKRKTVKLSRLKPTFLSLLVRHFSQKINLNQHHQILVLLLAKFGRIH